MVVKKVEVDRAKRMFGPILLAWKQRLISKCPTAQPRLSRENRRPGQIKVCLDGICKDLKGMKLCMDAKRNGLSGIEREKEEGRGKMRKKRWRGRKDARMVVK